MGRCIYHPIVPSRWDDGRDLEIDVTRDNKRKINSRTQNDNKVATSYAAGGPALSLIALVFSRVQRDSTTRFVRPSNGPDRPTETALRTHILLFYDFYFFTSMLLPKWSSDLKYGPFPPARYWGSRVSGLVFLLRVV